MTKDTQREWVDDFLIPALREVMGSEILAHHPRSWTEARHRARARQALSTTGTDRSFIELAYDVPDTIGRQKDLLHLLWRAIRRRLDHASDAKWHDAQLVSFTYGCKLQYRDPSLHRLRHTFNEQLSIMFKTPYAEKEAMYVDLALEDVPRTEDGEPVILVRRSACNEYDMRQLGLISRSQFFQWHGTADGSSVRAEPGVKSTLRLGGLAYVQAYMTEKDLWVSPDRSTAPLFSETAYRNLGFTQDTLQGLYRSKRSRLAHDPYVRRRALSSFKAAIVRAGHVLDFHSTDRSTNFPCRQEWRITYHQFMNGNFTDLQPFLLDDDHHWPYFALRKSEVCEYLRMDINRWLIAICVNLSTPRHGPGVHAPLSAEFQHTRTAMLSMLFSCLELVVNSDCVALSSRLAHDRYERRRNLRVGATAKLWQRSKRDVVPLSEESESTDNDEAPTRSRNRRGLNFLSSLAKTGMLWLPFEAFSWHEMLFDPAFLRQTAFVNGHFLSQFGRSARVTRTGMFREFVAEVVHRLPPLKDRQPAHIRIRFEKEIAQPCRHLCYFRYSNWLLTQLESNGYITFDNLTPAERRGCYGLSHGLVKRALGGNQPTAQFPRGRGGGGKNVHAQGFTGFDNTLETRIQLLFDWDDGFARGSWEHSEWREWTREIYDAIQVRHGEQAADRFKNYLGDIAARHGYITILPKYEEGKCYQTAKPLRRGPGRQEASQMPLLWSVSFPSEFQWSNRHLKLSTSQLNKGWELVTQANSRRYLPMRAAFDRKHQWADQGKWLPGIQKVAGAPDPERDGSNQWRTMRLSARGYTTHTTRTQLEDDGEGSSWSGPSFDETVFSSEA